MLSFAPRILWMLFWGGLFLAAPVMPASAADALLEDAWTDGLAIRGYDPVAYFTERRPVKGSAEFDYVWDEAHWHFASAENRDLFAADPERYAPQFGAYCAAAMVDGEAYAADPEAWTIIDGRLYLNYSPRHRDRWRQNLAENIARADAQWSALHDLD